MVGRTDGWGPATQEAKLERGTRHNDALARGREGGLCMVSHPSSASAARYTSARTYGVNAEYVLLSFHLQINPPRRSHALKKCPTFADLYLPVWRQRRLSKARICVRLRVRTTTTYYYIYIVLGSDGRRAGQQIRSLYIQPYERERLAKRGACLHLGIASEGNGTQNMAQVRLRHSRQRTATRLPARPLRPAAARPLLRSEEWQ